MSHNLSLQYALRSLGRSRRRTGLSILGVGLGCAIALFATAFMRGGQNMRMQAISESGYGHLRIAPEGWEQSRRDELRLQDSAAALEAAHSLEGVAIVAAHVRVQGLLAFGARVAGVHLLGVDPAAEPQLNRLVRTIDEGRYLQPGDEGAVVVGKALVKRLDVELGDDLLLTLTRADGEMEYAMLRIVGIVSTGSRAIDETICHAMLADVERMTGLQGAGRGVGSLRGPAAGGCALGRAGAASSGRRSAHLARNSASDGRRCGGRPSLLQFFYRSRGDSGNFGRDERTTDGHAGKEARICRADGTGTWGIQARGLGAFRGRVHGCARCALGPIARVAARLAYGDRGD